MSIRYPGLLISLLLACVISAGEHEHRSDLQTWIERNREFVAEYEGGLQIWPEARAEVGLADSGRLAGVATVDIVAQCRTLMTPVFGKRE